MRKGLWLLVIPHGPAWHTESSNKLHYSNNMQLPKSLVEAKGKNFNFVPDLGTQGGS